MQIECSRHAKCKNFSQVCGCAVHNNFVSSLIEYIAEDSEDHVGSLIGQSLAYTIIVFVLGKIIIYNIRKKQHEVEEANKHIPSHNPSRENSIVTVSSYATNVANPPPVVHKSKWWDFVSKYKLDEFVCSTCTENAGFAWKEFLVIYVLEFFNEEYGYGAGWGMWVMWVGIFIISLRMFGRFQKRLQLSPHLGALMLHFDTEAYAFAIAYVLSALIALGFQEEGAQYVRNDSFIFEWKHDDDTAHESNEVGNDGTVAYFSAVSFFVGIILLMEELCFKLPSDDDMEVDRAHTNLHEEPEYDHGVTITKGPDEGSEIRESMFEHMLGVDPHEQSALMNLWHNTLG